MSDPVRPPAFIAPAAEVGTSRPTPAKARKAAPAPVPAPLSSPAASEEAAAPGGNATPDAAVSSGVAVGSPRAPWHDPVFMLGFGMSVLIVVLLVTRRGTCRACAEKVEALATASEPVDFDDTDDGGEPYAPAADAGSACGLVPWCSLGPDHDGFCIRFVEPPLRPEQTATMTPREVEEAREHLDTLLDLGDRMSIPAEPDGS